MSKIISFIKMHGAGNDFVFIEEKKSISKKKALAVELCRRQFGIGADGAVFWKKTGAGKYKWDFYNADGSDADFCGNAARALVKLLILEKKIKPTQSVQISTQAGLMIGKRVGKLIEVQMPVFPKAAKVKGKTIIHSGVPHLIIPMAQIQNATKFRKGSFQLHKKNGTNLTFVKKLKNKIEAITFERGVEDFTQACGTGAMAAAFHFGKTKAVVQMPGGKLMARFDNKNQKAYLTGPAEFVAYGEYIRS